MSAMTQTGFDYAALPVDAALNARAAAERIKLRLKRTVEDIIEIGRELTAVKAELPHGNFLPWIAAEFEMTKDTAQNFMSVFDRFGKNGNFPFLNLKPSILYALSAPSTPESVIDKAVAKAESGKKVTVANVKDWKAELEAERQRREAAEKILLEEQQRCREFGAESNERRLKIKQLETHVAGLERRINDYNAQPVPEPKTVETIIEKVIEKPVIPPEFASLEEAIAAKRTELNRLGNDATEALARNKTIFDYRTDLQQEVEALESLLSRHKAAEREMVEHKRLTDEAIHFTAVFLAELEALEHAPDAAQRIRWQQAQQQFLDVAHRIDGSLHRYESAPLEGELLECAA